MKSCILCGTMVAALLVGSAAWGAGLWLYEIGTPDVGTAAAGRVAMATDASSAGANPAGMTRLDRSQMLVGLQGLYVDAQFDTQRSGFGGGDGGNAGGFVPVGSFHYVHRLTPDWRLGISVGSYFGLGVDYGDDWSGRYYIKKAEMLTFGVNPVWATGSPTGFRWEPGLPSCRPSCTRRSPSTTPPFRSRRG